MWENMTFDTIIQDMLDKVSDDMDKRQGSVIWDALAPAALELEAAYLIMEYTLNQAFPDTADREYLIRKALERSITPIPAKPAIVKGVFAPSTVDVTGIRFNLGNENFVVGDPIEGEDGAYQLTCETPGLEGNVSLGNLIPIDHVDGLTSAVATEFITLGTDEEDTEVFRQRYFDSFASSSFGGNIADYKEKCLSFDGVGGCKVIPVWNGGGTVKCLILNNDMESASSSLVEEIQEAIDPNQDGNGLGVAPIGHVVTVATPESIAVNITVTIGYETGYNWTAVENRIEEVINNYLSELISDWCNDYTDNIIVNTSQILSKVSGVKGVRVINSVKINNSTSNYTVPENKIPVLGELING